MALAIGGVLREAATHVADDPARELRLMDLAERAAISAADPAVSLPIDRLLRAAEEQGDDNRDLRGLLHELAQLRRAQGDIATADALSSGLAAISIRLKSAE